MNKSNLTGFVLIFAIMMGFSWYQARQRNKQLEAQYQLDSIARVEQMAAMAMDSMKRAQGIVPENKVYYLKRACEISGMSYIGKQSRATCVKRQLICRVNAKQVLLQLFFSLN